MQQWAISRKPEDACRLLTLLGTMQNSISSDAHRKVKGSFGELKVATDLVRQGYAVFSELGDNSKVDLIALVEHVPVKLQVKCYASSNGVVSVYGRKTGPNYRYRYRREQIDVFAVCVYDRDIVLYVSASEIVGHGRIKLRFDAPGNGQRKGIRWYHDYLDFRESLRDYTPGTLT